MAVYDWSPVWNAINGLVDKVSQENEYRSLFNNGGLLGVTNGAGGNGILGNASPDQIAQLQHLPPALGMKFIGNMMKPKEFSTTPQFDAQGRAFVQGTDGSTRFLDPSILPREKKEVAGNGVVYNPYTVAPGASFSDPNKPFALGPDGQPVANKGYQNYMMSKARAGAPSVTVNTDKSFGAELGSGAAKTLDATSTAARGAVQTITTANQIRDALGSGKVIAGPGASFRLAGAQLLGNDPERLTQTRTAIQGMASLTLAARGALKGQGQISDYEGKLLQKAASGDIDSLTVPEIKTIADISERAARQTIRNNKSMVDKAKAVPGSGDVVGFYSVDEPAAYTPKAPASTPSMQDLVDEARRRGLVK